MTDAHPRDELLSALIDGEGGAEWSDHVDRCPSCQARREALAEVSRVVGTPVAQRDSPEVTAAVSRALAAAANGSSGAEPEISSASSMGRTLADAANDKAPGPGRRRIVALAALAAVFVAVAGIASLLAVGARHGHSTGGTSAAGAPASSGPVQPGAAAGAPQLGEQSDPAALAATLRRLLGEASSGSAGSAEAAAPSAPTASCGAAAAASAGLPADARPLLTAGLQWRGQPAEATVFDRPAGSGGRIAVVTSIAGCTVLAHAPV